MIQLTTGQFIASGVAVVFGLCLILFPSFRKQLGSLVGGFLQIFIQDRAKTPDGAKAIYAQKIDEMQDKYEQACETLQELAGKKKTAGDNYVRYKRAMEDADKKARAAMSKGDRETAVVYAQQMQDAKSEMENYQEQFFNLTPLVEEATNIKDTIAQQLDKLKRESKNAVSEMILNNQMTEAYASMDKLRAASGTDKMLSATREGVQQSRERAAGAKTIYQTSKEGRAAKANARSSDYEVEAYLNSISGGAKVYDVQPGQFTKGSGQAVNLSKK